MLEANFGQKIAAQYVIPTVQKPEGVMVWAAMDVTGKIVLRRYPPKVNSIELW